MAITRMLNILCLLILIKTNIRGSPKGTARRAHTQYYQLATACGQEKEAYADLFNSFISLTFMDSALAISRANQLRKPLIN